MSVKHNLWMGFATATLLSACAHMPNKPAPSVEIPPVITTLTQDNITVYGENYLGDLDASAPLILLFHQGGSNGCVGAEKGPRCWRRCRLCH